MPHVEEKELIDRRAKGTPELRGACEKSARTVVSAVRRAVPGKASREALTELADSLTGVIEQTTELLDVLHENRFISVVGSSGCGKSSLINALVGQRALARTSNTPGRTQELNLFAPEEGGVRIVDMPGYGFAKAPKPAVEKWNKLIHQFLRGRPKICFSSGHEDEPGAAQGDKPACEEMIGDGDRRGNAQPRLGSQSQVRDGGHHLRGDPDNPAGPVGYDHPFVGQARTRRCALQELQAHLTLELGHAHADCGLGHLVKPCGLPEASVFGDAQQQVEADEIGDHGRQLHEHRG